MLPQKVLPPTWYRKAIDQHFADEGFYPRYSAVDVCSDFKGKLIKPYIRGNDKIKRQIEEEFIYWHTQFFTRAVIILPEEQFKTSFNYILSYTLRGQSPLKKS